jgi:hypothetical protein
VKLYENGPRSDEWLSFGIAAPEDFFTKLKIGWVIIDEAHEHLHRVHSMMLYMHVDKDISLSGTFEADDIFIKRIQAKMYPREIRFEGKQMAKYIGVFAMSYYFRDLDRSRIKTSYPRNSMYSHIAFEQTLMRDKTVCANYVNMVVKTVESFYARHRKPGQKCAVYAASIAMCTLLTDRLKETFPALDVRRYAEKDPYENVIDADIRVTTIGSGGTAVDIPNLITTVFTVSVNATISNKQTLGRLREIPGADVQFVYLWCPQLRKQKEYHYTRMEMFKPRVAFIKEIQYAGGMI